MGKAGEWLPANRKCQVQNIGQKGVLPQLLCGRNQPMLYIHCPSTLHCSRTTFPPQGIQLLQGSCPQLLPASITVENNHVPNRRRRLCQLNGMNCKPQITHTCFALSATSSLSLSLSLPHSRCVYMLAGAVQLYGLCVPWQCERHRKERPHFLWCSRCCGPEEIRTHTYTRMDAHPAINKQSQHRSMLPALTPPPFSLPPLQISFHAVWP